MKKSVIIIVSFLLAIGGAAQKFQNKVSDNEMLERFLTYVSIESTSVDSDLDSFPMTEGQKQIAQHVYDECRQIAKSRSDIRVVLSTTYYVYVDIASNMKHDVPSLMLMAHLDVTPEAPGEGIKPMVHRDYDGGEIQLSAGITLNPDLPLCARLKELVGHTIVSSDGRTLLGADDKTGCAIIVSLLDELVRNPKVMHGRILLCFSQNEDVGKAHLGFDKNILGTMPDVVIDVDGGNAAEYSVANFTAVYHAYRFTGNLVHPSDAKAGRYADALTAACYFIGQIPPELNPAQRDGEEGYIHCYSMLHPTDEQGQAVATDWIVKLRLRYFSQEEGEYQKKLIAENLRRVQEAFPNVEAVKTDDVVQYSNVAYTMPAELPSLIEASARDAGLEWHPASIRGGSTGSMLVSVYPDMPGASCIYSGQQAEHSVFEYCSVQEMQQILSVLENIILRVATMKEMPTASSQVTQSQRKNHTILNTVRKKLPKGVD